MLRRTFARISTAGFLTVGAALLLPIPGIMSITDAIAATDDSATEAPDNVAAAAAHIDNMIADMNGLLATDNGDITTRRTIVTTLMDTYFDFDGITRFSAGQYWRAATKAEQAEYKTVIREVIIGTVVRNFDQLKGLNYAPKAAKAKGGKLVIVSGMFNDVAGQRPSVMVNWRVTTLPGKPARVLDIEIENISMLVTQKQENVAIIRQNKGAFSALITAMKKRLEN